jgi:hypothetical protein
MHIHTAGGGRDAPCTFTLLVVEGMHPARPYCWRWKGCTLHVHTAGGERDAPCTSILLAVKWMHPARPYFWKWKGCTLHAHTAMVGKISPCMYILWRWKGVHRLHTSNGNEIETIANESFDNGVFFDIEEKLTPSIISKSCIFEAKRTHSLEQKLFSDRSEHVR